MYENEGSQSFHKKSEHMFALSPSVTGIGLNVNNGLKPFQRARVLTSKNQLAKRVILVTVVSK